MSKRIWETPKLETFGSMRELTAEKADPNPGDPNAKLPGDFDGSPFSNCPPGQYKMSPLCPGGQGGVS